LSLSVEWGKGKAEAIRKPSLLLAILRMFCISHKIIWKVLSQKCKPRSCELKRISEGSKFNKSQTEKVP